MESLNHLISLTVGTHSAEQHAEVFDGVTNYSKLLAAMCDYVSVSTELVDEDDEGVDEELDELILPCEFEHLCHDDNTLLKVRQALKEAVISEFTVSVDTVDDVVEDMIVKMQNAGILFREHLSDDES